jgi:hypothetical protein
VRFRAPLNNPTGTSVGGGDGGSGAGNGNGAWPGLIIGGGGGGAVEMVVLVVMEPEVRFVLHFLYQMALEETANLQLWLRSDLLDGTTTVTDNS